MSNPVREWNDKILEEMIEVYSNLFVIIIKFLGRAIYNTAIIVVEIILFSIEILYKFIAIVCSFIGYLLDLYSSNEKKNLYK